MQIIRLFLAQRLCALPSPPLVALAAEVMNLCHPFNQNFPILCHARALVEGHLVSLREDNLYLTVTKVHFQHLIHSSDCYGAIVIIHNASVSGRFKCYRCKELVVMRLRSLIEMKSNSCVMCKAFS